MLVVDLHTLQAVDVLNLVDDVFLYGCGTLDGQDVGRSYGTVGERRTGTNIVVVLYQDLLGDGHKVLADIAHLGGDGDFAIATLEASHGDDTVDFGNDRGIAGIAGLEQLGHTRQTTGDVTATANDTGYLDKDFAHTCIGTVADGDMATDGEVVGTQQFAILVQYVTGRNLVAVLRLYDDVLALLGGLVCLHAVGDILYDVLELYLTGRLGNDNRVERIPLGHDVALLDEVALLLEQGAAVRNVLAEQHDAGLGLHKADFSQAADHDLGRTGIGLGIYGTQFLKLEACIVLGLYLSIGNGVAGHTTGVERTQRQLCTGFTDGLCGNDAHSLTDVHHAAGSQVAAITLDADALVAFAGQHGTYFNHLYGAVLYLLCLGLGDFVAGSHYHLTCSGMDDIVNADTAQNAVVE